jgi:septal ring factor EnvC (AmiA/AmiB activator)
VSTELITRDEEGKPQTVRYEAVNAMLLNEFLKEHRKFETQTRKVNDQEATIAQQQKEIQTLIASVREQSAQIQKVSARLEASNAVSQTAFNDR